MGRGERDGFSVIWIAYAERRVEKINLQYWSWFGYLVFNIYYLPVLCVWAVHVCRAETTRRWGKSKKKKYFFKAQTSLHFFFLNHLNVYFFILNPARWSSRAEALNISRFPSLREAVAKAQYFFSSSLQAHDEAQPRTAQSSFHVQ